MWLRLTTSDRPRAHWNYVLFKAPRHTAMLMSSRIIARLEKRERRMRRRKRPTMSKLQCVNSGARSPCAKHSQRMPRGKNWLAWPIAGNLHSQRMPRIYVHYAWPALRSASARRTDWKMVCRRGAVEGRGTGNWKRSPFGDQAEWESLTLSHLLRTSAHQAHGA